MKHWYEGERMINEAIDYFSNNDTYHRLFSLFRNKYESLGRIGGTIKLDAFSDEDLKTIACFFGLMATDLKQKGKISLEGFEKQLQSTKFAGVSLKQLLEAYFNEPLISKRERKQLKEQKQEQFFNQLERDFPRLGGWLLHLRKKTPDTYWIFRLIENDPNNFLTMIKQLENALTHLPSSFERLPMFSQRITRNPHAFDLNTNLGKLLIHLLTVDHHKSDPIVVPADSEGINDLLLKYNILRDDITNDVTCVNLLAETKDGLHPMWEAASRMHSVMNTPLRELIALTRVYPARREKIVWIVENSGVYSSMIDYLPDTPLICTHGQFKLAALMLIDLLVEEGCTLYYAGDLDPEGISMAERLLQRHPNHVRPWKMDVAAYRKSEADIELSNERLKKLDSITSAELAPIAEELRKRKKAGYQEALVGEMVDELGRR